MMMRERFRPRPASNGMENQTEVYLSVIIPAYNEEQRLSNTLEEVDKYLSKQPYTYEIIVISDGSKDGTAKVVENYLPKINGLKLIDNKENHGKGYVVRQAMLAAKGEHRLFTDADNSTTVEQVENMRPFFKEGYDIVIGSRDVKGAVLAVPQPWWRIMLGDTFNLVVKIVAGLWGISDTQCGFKGFTAKSVQDIFPKCRIDRWAFDVEILVIARKYGYKIKEMPVTWINDPNSKVKLKGMIKMLSEVLQVRLNSLLGKYKNLDSR